MTELIKAQLTIVCVMGGGGLAAGLVYDVFETFISLRRWRGWRKWSLEIFAFLCIGFLTGEFLYTADRGKLTFLSICAFACGLWLYKKIFVIQCPCTVIGKPKAQTELMQDRCPSEGDWRIADEDRAAQRPGEWKDKTCCFINNARQKGKAWRKRAGCMSLKRITV